MNRTITLSRTTGIIKCCLIAGLIAALFAFAGRIELNQFIDNLKSWQSI